MPILDAIATNRYLIAVPVILSRFAKPSRWQAQIHSRVRRPHRRRPAGVPSGGDSPPPPVPEPFRVGRSIWIWLDMLTVTRSTYPHRLIDRPSSSTA